MDKSVFSKFIARIRNEGILKSLLYGLINGFAVNFLIMAVFYLINIFVDTNNLLAIGFWLSIGLGLAVGLLTGFIVYFVKFKPTTKRVAERVDSLGLEERLITMLEFENDESYIAMKQREDAQEQLKKVKTDSIKFNFAKSVTIAAVVLTVIGISMTTVGALTTFNVIEPVTPPVIIEPEDYQPVTYLVDGEGRIMGYDYSEKTNLEDTEDIIYSDQLVLIGEDAATVIAVPEEGFAFYCWQYEDGTTDEFNKTPIRTDTNISGPLTMIAVFEELQENEDGNPGEGGDNPNNKDEDTPPEKGDEAAPDEDKEGNGEQAPPSDKDSDSNKDSNNDTESKEETNKEQESSSAGQTDRYAQMNKFKDGETPYQDEFEMWNDQARQELQDNDNLTEEQRQMADLYLKSLATGVGSSSSSSDDNSDQ